MADVRVHTLLPTLKGLNYDTLKDQIPAGFATVLDNFSPFTDRISQKSKETLVQTVGTAFYTYTALHNFIDGTGAPILVVGVENKLYEVSLSGGISTIQTFTSPTCGWFMTTWRKRLFIIRFPVTEISGAEDSIVPESFHRWDGTTLSNALTGYTCDGSSSYLPSFMCPHKGALYLLVQKDGEIELRYSGPNQITGALEKFDVSGILQKGGFPLALGSLSRMSSSGDVSQFVVISSEGEVLVYNGLNPSTTDWILVRRLTIPKPLHLMRYCKGVISANEDVYVLTRAGVISINAMLNGSLNGKISPIASEISRMWDYQTSVIESGKRTWDHNLYYDQNKKWLITALGNVSQRTKGSFITNLETLATSFYKNNIGPWASQDETLFFFDALAVYSIDENYTSKTEPWEVASHWSDLGVPNVIKTITGVRIRLDSFLTNASQDVNFADFNDISIRIDPDFNVSTQELNFSRSYIDRTSTPDPWVPIQSSGTKFRIIVKGATLKGITIGAIDIRYVINKV